MVEASTSGQVGMIVGHPTPERGHRTSMYVTKNGKELIYACKNNFVVRGESIESNHVYARNKDPITCVS